MSSTFTPSQAVDMSKEKDWPVHLGMLDWDHTRVVFTKRSLVEFLKYAGVTIDPGFTNIQKLPRYAQFGNLVASAASEEEATTEEIVSATSTVQSPSGSGVQRLFEEEFVDDALSTAPPPPPDVSSQSKVPKPSRRVRATPGGTSSVGSMFSDDAEQFIPTRRVRQRPGGEDNIEGLF